MQIIVENKTFDIELPDHDVVLKDVIEEVETALLELGRVPQTLTIDGKELTQEELEVRLDNTMLGSEVLEFGVLSFEGFVLNSLEGSGKANEDLLKKLEAFANDLQENAKRVDSKALVQDFRDFLEFWMKMQGFFPEAFQSLKFNDKSGSEFFEALRSLLEEVVKSMGANDFTLAGDLLRYEVIPLVDSVQKVIPEFRKQIEQKQSEASKA